MMRRRSGSLSTPAKGEFWRRASASAFQRHADRRDVDISRQLPSGAAQPHDAIEQHQPALNDAHGKRT